ncbi:Cmx/CmrA family chloramphenicol efflux MFS transporter [Pseudonocardia acaciae]|uniref:Cmx/CmrA family chloramphenicol efflux MFS transporter n=1 Tax=Pseudonocardia acaciae TaxID=551276 RepID=UPI0012ECF102|nr:Cmx/CmrA family chloramphenicol efflux MFS transporter [Pseudonocardia acaciae]
MSEARTPGAVYLLGASIFVLGTTEFVIAGLLPELSADLGVSLPEAGLLISAFAVAMVVGAPVLAVLTLRLPRRATLLGALGLFAAGQVLGALAGDYPTLMVARVITAAATGAFWAVAGVVAVSMVPPGQRARALSLLLGGLTTANVLGVPLGTLVGQQWGWRATFWAIAVAAVVAMAGIWGWLPVSGVGGGPAVGVRAEVRAFRSGRLWLALGTSAVFEAGVMGAFGYLAPVVTDVAGLPGGAVPVVLTLYGVGSLVGVRLGGRWADARPWGTLYLALGVIACALLVLAAAARVPGVPMVAAFVLGLAVFVAGTALTARVFALAGPAPTLASAANASAFNVGNTVGPWLGGLVIAGLGLRAPAVLGAVLAGAALGLGLVSRALETPGPGVPHTRESGLSSG